MNTAAVLWTHPLHRRCFAPCPHAILQTFGMLWSKHATCRRRMQGLNCVRRKNASGACPRSHTSIVLMARGRARRCKYRPARRNFNQPRGEDVHPDLCRDPGSGHLDGVPRGRVPVCVSAQLESLLSVLPFGSFPRRVGRTAAVEKMSCRDVVGDAGCGVPDGVAGEVGVAGGGLDLGVAQQLRDHRQALAEGKGAARVGVAQVVDAHVVEAGAGAHAAPRLEDAGETLARLAPGITQGL